MMHENVEVSTHFPPRFVFQYLRDQTNEKILPQDFHIGHHWSFRANVGAAFPFFQPAKMLSGRGEINFAADFSHQHTPLHPES